MLSIDLTVQSIAERHLRRAVIDNQCLGGGAIIIMEPATGNILAMAEYPNYDLNDPFTINNDELAVSWDTMRRK
ncbi:MAG: hypothetical protein FWC79_04840 [Oscillospiraceae bacterium]|nr:hypothetical protein [Oscillospiraceae bacterium]